MKKRLKHAKRSKLYTVTMWAVAAALTVGSAGSVIAAEGFIYSTSKTYNDSTEHHENDAVVINSNAVINVNGSTTANGLGGRNGLTVESGSTVNVFGGAVLYGGSGGYGVNNIAGTVNLYNKAQLWFGANSENNSISESAVINVIGDNVTIEVGEKGTTSDGTINVDSGSKLNLITGYDSALSSSAPLSIAGTFTQASGTINIASGGELNTGSSSSGNSQGANVSIGGTVNNSGTWKAGLSSVTVIDGGTLNNEKGTIDGSVTVNSNGTLIADASNDASITRGVTANAGSNIKLANLQVGDDVSSLFNNNFKNENANISSTNPILIVDSTGSVGVNSDTSSTMPGISGRLGNLLVQGVNSQQIVKGAEGAGARFLSSVLENGTMDGAQKAKTIESAAKLAVIGAAPHMTWGIHQQGTHIMLNRTSLLSPSTSGMAVMDSQTQKGASSGDKLNEGFAIWAMPFYQHMETSGMKSGSYDLDIDSDLAGLAMGADYTFNNTRIGVAFNAGTGDVTGKGDLSRTTNDVDFWGVGLYFGKAIDNIGIKADISYTSTSNDMKQNVVGMDALKSDVDARAISVGVEGEYQIKTASLDVAPYVGVRYTDMEVDDYRVKSGGETVLKGHAIDQKVWTFPVGVRLSKEVDSASGWQVRPNVDVAIIPAVGDTRADSRIQFVGVDGTANLTTRVMDNVSYMGQAGIEFVKKDLRFGLNYNYQGSSHSDMHSLFANVRYEF